MNQDIKKVAKEKGVKLWKIAERLRITDSSFSRMLRYELSSEEKEKIKSIIEDLENENRS
ncbi:hypothetical protein EDC18_10523 [Natranaerovirga pectinivora]|uniref:HTH cro/C1-type domain-containing protein n=1 Tax=Natranaerovirga pectinivora TaxID=682400 RepID=A0A4R3MMZ1_9FIRM|nr:hypothetical protein [Natranaerovirga pectinivora]TCT14542.1 hypothetical protein EDC18_10523 [Natranaerovirga pectinivora]